MSVWLKWALLLIVRNHPRKHIVLLTLMHSEQPNVNRVLSILSAVGLTFSACWTERTDQDTVNNLKTGTHKIITIIVIKLKKFVSTVHRFIQEMWLEWQIL